MTQRRGKRLTKEHLVIRPHAYNIIVTCRPGEDYAVYLGPGVAVLFALVRHDQHAIGIKIGLSHLGTVIEMVGGHRRLGLTMLTYRKFVLGTGCDGHKGADQ